MRSAQAAVCAPRRPPYALRADGVDAQLPFFFVLHPLKFASLIDSHLLLKLFLDYFFKIAITDDQIGRRRLRGAHMALTFRFFRQTVQTQSQTSSPYVLRADGADVQLQIAKSKSRFQKNRAAIYNSISHFRIIHRRRNLVDHQHPTTHMCCHAGRPRESQDSAP